MLGIVRRNIYPSIDVALLYFELQMAFQGIKGKVNFVLAWCEIELSRCRMVSLQSRENFLLIHMTMMVCYLL